MYVRTLQSDFKETALFFELHRSCPRITDIARWAKQIGARWADEILKRGAVASPHPQTGEMIDSVGFVSPTCRSTFIEFMPPDMPPYCLIGSRINLGYEIGGIYFPQSKFLFRWDDHTYGAGVDAAERYSQIKAARTSGQAVPPPIEEGVTLLLGHENFAHHAMNELSGLWRISEAGLSSRIRNVFTQFESLGAVSDVLPPFAHLLEKKLASRDNFETPKNHHVLMLGGTLVSRELRELLRSYLERIVNRLYPSHVSDFLSGVGRPIFIALRTHSRVVENNAELTIRVCQKLRDRIGAIRPIIDGFSLPHDLARNANYAPWFADQGRLSLQQSESLAEKFAEHGFNDVVCTANKDILLALWMSMHTEFYFSNQGTQQHKAAWFSSGRGVVHFPPDRDQANAVHWFKKIVQGVPEFDVLPTEFTKSFSEDSPRGNAGYLFQDIDRASDWIVSSLLNEPLR